MFRIQIFAGEKHVRYFRWKKGKQKVAEIILPRPFSRAYSPSKGLQVEQKSFMLHQRKRMGWGRSSKVFKHSSSPSSATVHTKQRGHSRPIETQKGTENSQRGTGEKETTWLKNISIKPKDEFVRRKRAIAGYSE